MFRLDDKQVQTKLFLCTIVFMVGFVLFGAVSFNTLRTVKVNGPFYKNIVQSKDVIADILPPPKYIIESYLVALQMLDETDSTKVNKLIERSKTLQSEYEARHVYWQKDLEESELKEKLLVKSFLPAKQYFQIQDGEFIPAIKSGDRSKAKTIFHERMTQEYETHRAAIEEAVQLAVERNKNDEMAAANIISKRTWLLVGLGLLIAAVGSFLSWKIGLRITMPIDELLRIVKAAARLDLTQDIFVNGKDAIGQMGLGLGQCFNSLRDSLGRIGKNAQVLSMSSQQLSSVSNQMSTHTNDTASQANVVSAAAEQVSKSVQTVATATEEMTASIKEIAKNAVEAAKVATTAVEVANTTNATISKLGDSSSEIGNVIKVITSIAQQTNLLALNATIEAARAGEVGKGFAVVANEVKELAKETAKATEDISRKIEAIQDDSKGAVEAIKKITLVINQVNDISNTIASAVEQQTATTNEISRNVAEAAKGSSEIARSITRVAESAQQTTGGATDIQKSAQELARMSTELQNLIGQFKFEKGRSERSEFSSGSNQESTFELKAA